MFTLYTFYLLTSSVAAILQCYGVKKPVCYIRDNEVIVMSMLCCDSIITIMYVFAQTNVEEAKQLMVKLARVASRQ